MSNARQWKRGEKPYSSMAAAAASPEPSVVVKASLVASSSMPLESNVDSSCVSLVSLPDELKCMIDTYLSFSDKSNLAQTCRAYYSFFNPTLVKSMDPDEQLTCQPYIRSYRKQVQKFLNHVICGEQKDAETMLACEPALLLAVGRVKDYSGRRIEGTALQLALGAEDIGCHPDEVGMVEMIYNHLMQLDNGEVIIAEQTAKQFPDGWQAKERQRAKCDEHMLHAVINKIANSDKPADWVNAIQLFKNYLKSENKGSIFHVGKHFNHQLLVKALYLYVKYYEKLGGFNSIKNNTVWRSVIGTIERYVPAATAQALCTGVDNMLGLEQLRLKRDLTLHDTGLGESIFYFPLGANPVFILGIHFAVYSYYRHSEIADVVLNVDLIDQFIDNKSRKLEKFIQCTEGKFQSDRPGGCVIS